MGGKGKELRREVDGFYGSDDQGVLKQKLPGCGEFVKIYGDRQTLGKPVEVRQEHHQSDKANGQQYSFQCFINVERGDLFHKKIIFLG